MESSLLAIISMNSSLLSRMLDDFYSSYSSFKYSGDVISFSFSFSSEDSVSLDSDIDELLSELSDVRYISDVSDSFLSRVYELTCRL